MWFQQYQPSIGFLELYALLAGVVTWVPHLSNKTVILDQITLPQCMLYLTSPLTVTKC